MLFPGHERSQNLLASSSNSSDRKLAQDHPRGEKSTLGTHPLNINSVQDNRQIYAFSDSPRPHPKNDPKLAPAHTRAHSDDKWPNGVPPAGPRNLLEHSRQFPSSWYSGVSERDRFPDAKSCTPKSNAPKLRLSPTYSKRFSGTKTTKLHGKVVEGSSSVILDCNKSSFLTGSEVNLEIHPHGTKDILQERNHESPNLHPASGSNGLVCSSLESVTLLNRKSVPTVPQASLLVMKMPGGIDMDEAIVNPKGTANKTEVSDKGSLPSPLHKDIAYVMNHSHRSSSEAASVTSAASSIAGKSSSSSISSHLRLSICNTCKKPPFRERLKGCFECSRHYHKGCAKPKDR